MKMGAEPKKIKVLVGLVAVAGIVYWMNSSPDSPPSSTAARPAADAVAVAPVAAGKTVTRRTATGHAHVGDVSFSLSDKVDPAKVDPTLRLDLLAKVQSIEMEGGVRNIFKFDQPPLPPALLTDKAIPKVDPLHPNATAPAAGAAAAASAPPPQPGPPPAAPINLKYYGYSTKRSDGEKKAFFLDGDDVIVASEGDIINKHYKVVRIGVNSVQMEDTTSKSTQTLPLQQEAAPA